MWRAMSEAMWYTMSEGGAKPYPQLPQNYSYGDFYVRGKGDWVIELIFS